MTHQSHQHVAASLRAGQAGFEADLNQQFAADPERLSLEKAAFELTCLLYDNLSPEVKFIIQGQDLRPTVTALHRHSPVVAESEMAEHAPFLLVVFGHASEIYKEIERVLQLLTGAGVAAREPFLAESNMDEGNLAEYVDGYYSFQTIPIILGGLELHGSPDEFPAA